MKQKNFNEVILFRVNNDYIMMKRGYQDLFVSKLNLFMSYMIRQIDGIASIHLIPSLPLPPYGSLKYIDLGK